MDIRVLHALASWCAVGCGQNPTSAFAGDGIPHARWKIRLNSSSAGGIMFFFHFHLSGGKDDFSLNLLEPWEHWQPRGQSPGTSLAKSVPQASPPHRPCREARPLHHHPAQEQSLVLVWLMVFEPNDRSARREGCNAAGSVNAAVFIFSSICC